MSIIVIDGGIMANTLCPQQSDGLMEHTVMAFGIAFCVFAL
jgi:hypothetical protein